MQLLLAPMEGLLDFVLRDVLTRIGGAGSLRFRIYPHQWHALAGSVFFCVICPSWPMAAAPWRVLPVRAQLLGSDPVSMAENAAFLATLGPEGIDLNLSAARPAPWQPPRWAVPPCCKTLKTSPAWWLLCAVPCQPICRFPPKMRLGFDDRGLMRECAQAMVENGACELGRSCPHQGRWLPPARRTGSKSR